MLGKHCVVWPGVEESHHQVGVGDLWRERNNLLQRGRAREHIVLLRRRTYACIIVSCTKLTPKGTALSDIM